MAAACVAPHAVTSNAAKSVAARSDSVRPVVIRVLLCVMAVPFKRLLLFDIEHPAGGGDVQIGILNEQAACTRQCGTGNGER